MALPQLELPSQLVATHDEMAEILDIHPQTLFRRMAEGTAPPSFKIGNRRLFPLGRIFEAWCLEQVSAVMSNDKMARTRV
jgi:predicted DNA-binding transcriptional regulator AlpA